MIFFFKSDIKALKKKKKRRICNVQKTIIIKFCNQ